ncbi:MAG TPA: class I SAM-dependent RNA methyltransferase [Saprospiraceae bacterium]|nr:class I SAM-dependent RNA methyltransferase [Saprospiraceae bacterium]HRP42712.1 class I SAM-dependent RNA methyltransferase [Saprospiraceae bacterium]
MKIIIKTLEGLENVLKTELQSITDEPVTVLKRAVLCEGNKQLLYTANLHLRTALKVLVILQEFTVRDEKDLYEQVKKIKWEDYFGLNETFAIDSVVNSSIFRHSNYIALKTKDAIVDRFRQRTGDRPNVDTTNPDFRINVHIREEIVTVSIDSSGKSLHMRGYRTEQVAAPLNEVLAAGMVLLSEWNGKTPLTDPMCGSGTILCEAAKIAGNIPPQKLDRDFAFKKWKNFDSVLWNDIINEAQKRINYASIPEIKGFDISSNAVKISKINIENAGLSEYIQIEEEDFFYQDDFENTTLIFNPPYDGRMKESDILVFYKDIGDKLKRAFKDCTAWILSAHLDAIKNLGLRASSKIKLLNGELPSLFCKYEMYSGSKKQKWQTNESSGDH